MSKSDGALNNYLQELGRVPLLTPDEEIELGAESGTAIHQFAKG